MCLYRRGSNPGSKSRQRRVLKAHPDGTPRALVTIQQTGSMTKENFKNSLPKELVWVPEKTKLSEDSPLQSSVRKHYDCTKPPLYKPQKDHAHFSFLNFHFTFRQQLLFQLQKLLQHLQQQQKQQ